MVFAARGLWPFSGKMVRWGGRVTMLLLGYIVSVEELPAAKKVNVDRAVNAWRMESGWGISLGGRRICVARNGYENS